MKSLLRVTEMGLSVSRTPPASLQTQKHDKFYKVRQAEVNIASYDIYRLTDYEGYILFIFQVSIIF